MRLVILGSTGSIGRQTLDVVRDTLASRQMHITVLALTAHSNIDLLQKQIEEFHPASVCVTDEEQAEILKKRDPPCEVLSGETGIIQVAGLAEADTLLSAIVGIAGLKPAVAFIKSKKSKKSEKSNKSEKSGKTLALANKETLVTAGALVTRLAEERNVKVLPVDSEHSAIFQCLDGINSPRRIYLTASGGPFLTWSKDQIKHATLEAALKHPNWNMGKKITIDSATMMNKGLEIIEAMWLFGLKTDKIKVLIHPQSVIHSMVEYDDGAIIAQLGTPDMRLPIQYALTYPKRIFTPYERLDFMKYKSLSFEEPDYDKFPALRLALKAAEVGGLLPAVMNGANEEAVKAFINKEIPFTQIAGLIEHVMRSYYLIRAEMGGEKFDYTIDDVLQADAWARKEVMKF
ncbi:MAG: 1-deoxy-D-xylulose-5-phosphate reductoisomerase [Clostridiales bacterium]|jgi:1-deoxy-D-xylulose-5-phosphate reductoisomerase|nr:1-deoxy-D-xylulose-5-phosphate reductoisomerase [Clostridiales bacterium]